MHQNYQDSMWLAFDAQILPGDTLFVHVSKEVRLYFRDTRRYIIRPIALPLSLGTQQGFFNLSVFLGLRAAQWAL